MNDYGSGYKTYSGDEALELLRGLKPKLAARDLVNEGGEHFLAGNYSDAEKKWKEAIAVNPNNAVAHGNIGNIYYTKKQYNDAIPWLEKAISLDPKIEGVAHCLLQCRAEIVKKPSNPNSPSKATSTHKTKGWWQFWK
jgi:tetratricopeptide (TPR) repeat protein